MKQLWIGGAVRTAIGDLSGQFAGVGAVELGRAAVAASLQRAGVAPDVVDEVILGNVLQAGQGQNPARQVAIGCGVPQAVPSYTVNQVCGSGLKAIDLARQAILLGEAGVVVAGGMESMSNAPYILPALRQGARLGDATARDTIVFDGLSDAFGRCHMGMTAENIAASHGLTRDEQDRFALESQRRYAAALAQGRPGEEIVPVVVRQRRGEMVVDRDEHPRADATLEALARLRPAFKPDGTVTAGNASGINDGAAAVVVTGTAELLAADARRVRLRDVVCVGCAPDIMGMGPVGAVRKLLARQRLAVDDIDLWELNEAFAAQSLAVLRELRLAPDRVNVNGGAIALGHPIGCSGARIVVSLIHQMKRQQAALGVASLCVGGGMGLAILLEND
ncbi:MAG: acetyl-CoA C-acetyltransferase [Lentisphaerae bacterium]|nr:acetyl-CoA C-acetyltransferase [Lentisphaerota bacterium]